MSNSFDQDAALAVVEEIEREEALIQSSQAKHMKYARERRDAIKELKKAAKDDGLPEDVINGLLKTRKANNTIAEIRKNMSSDYVPIFIPLSEALGNFIDLPLGKAAAEAEQPELNLDPNEQTIDDITASEQDAGAEVLSGKPH